jgi:hypothetical protein
MSVLVGCESRPDLVLPDRAKRGDSGFGGKYRRIGLSCVADD